MKRKDLIEKKRSKANQILSRWRSSGAGISYLPKWVTHLLKVKR